MDSSGRDKESGLVLKCEEVFDGQKPAGQPEQWTLVRVTTGTEIITIGKHQLRCFVQGQKQTLATTELRWHELVSETVPGRRVVSKYWSKKEEQPEVEISLESWGHDPSLIAEYDALWPKLGIVTDREIEQRRKAEDDKSKKYVADLEARTLADLKSPDASKRLDAVNRLSGRPFSAANEPAALEGLKSALNDSSIEVRRRAAWGVGQRGIKGMTKQILELLQHDPQGTYHYLEALGLQGESEGQPVLVQYASSTNQFWRKAAVWSLREFKTEEARLALEKAIADPEWEVRMNAVESLGKLNDVHSLPALLRALRDENHLVVSHAIRAVVSLGDESAVPGLLELFKSKDEEVRMEVCMYIGQMKLKNTRAVCDALLERLNDKSKQVQTSAIASLAVFRERRAVPQLLAIAEDPSESSGGHWMQPPPGQIAFMALGAIGDPAALPLLIQKLDEPEWNKMACEALVAMGAESAKPLLDHYLRASGQQSRSDELAALAKVGTRETLSELQQYLAKCPPLEKRAIRSTITEIERRLSH